MRTRLHHPHATGSLDSARTGRFATPAVIHPRLESGSGPAKGSLANHTLAGRPATEYPECRELPVDFGNGGHMVLYRVNGGQRPQIDPSARVCSLQHWRRFGGTSGEYGRCLRRLLLPRTTLSGALGHRPTCATTAAGLDVRESLRSATLTLGSPHASA